MPAVSKATPAKSRRSPRRAGRRPGTSADPRMVNMDAAERLCAEHGLEAVSVRDIVAKAGVNLASINYYFGSRTNLLIAILKRRGTEIESERQQLLDEAARENPPQLRAIVKAMLTPLARWRDPQSSRQHALQFLSRTLSASIPEIKREIDRGVMNFRPVIGLLARALPHLSNEDICWRFHFMMSIEHMNQWDTERLQILSDGRCGTAQVDEELERAVDFIVGGFNTPPRPATRSRRG